MPMRETTHSQFVPRSRKVRILATLGPASSTPRDDPPARRGRRRRLPDQHEPRQPRRPSQADRDDPRLEKELDRPTTILADLQGPKLRVGKFAGDKARCSKTGQTFVFDRDEAPGDASRVDLPHREIFERGRARHAAAGRRRQARLPGGRGRAPTGSRPGSRSAARISNNKGLNVPDVVLPLAALTDKDRADLAFALDQDVDWIALELRPAARGRRRGAAADRRHAPLCSPRSRSRPRSTGSRASWSWPTR